MATTTKETKPVEAPSRKMVKVMIPKSREHMDDVFVGVNGETFLIQRGVEVEVPDYVKEVLDNKERMNNLALDRQMALQGK